MMRDILSFILIFFIIVFFIYLSNEVDVIGSNIEKMNKYNGSVVVNKFEESIIAPNILTVKIDSIRKDLFMEDIVFREFSVGDTVNINLNNK